MASELPRELPVEPNGYRRVLVMHLNFGRKGSSATYDVIAPDGTKLPVQYVVQTGPGYKIVAQDFYLEGSEEPLTWSALRAAWPAFLKYRERAAAAGKAKPLEMVVIYDRPHDAPDGYVARLWKVSPGKVLPDKLLGVDLGTLDAARELVPQGMVNIGRRPEDDPKIVEVWV